MPSLPLLHSSLLLFAILLPLAAVLTEAITFRGDVGLYETSLDGLQFLPPRGHSTNNDDALEVLNVVLVASVDGKFHALNRSTGGKLWSMPALPPSSTHGLNPPVPSILEPLVSTKHLDADPDVDDDPLAHETYIVEPQSGDIYVTTANAPTAPLQRLPFSMSQLVDMSPFSFDSRVFVGRKKTSILLIELETGRVKAALDSECPWDAWGEFTEQDVMDVDLDELEGIKPTRQYPTEIFIGRTGTWFSCAYPIDTSSDCQITRLSCLHTHSPIISILTATTCSPFVVFGLWAK